MHEDVADAILQMCGSGQGIDPVTLTDWMGGTPRFGTSGGQVYVFDIWQLSVLAVNTREYATQVHELAIKRRLAEGGIRQVQLARTPGLTAAEALAQAETGSDRRHRPGRRVDRRR